MNQGKLTWILRTTRVVLRTDAKDGGFTAIVANVAQYELNDVRSIKQDSFSLAMEANAEALEKLEDEDKEEIEEKTMTQMMGIFYMLYSAKKDSDFNIFNENGNEQHTPACTSLILWQQARIHSTDVVNQLLSGHRPQKKLRLLQPDTWTLRSGA